MTAVYFVEAVKAGWIKIGWSRKSINRGSGLNLNFLKR
jgi:hypothetical protein